MKNSIERESRVAELRDKGRRIFWFSMITAGLIHLVLLVVFQRHRVDVPIETAVRHEVNGESEILRFVDVEFGPPEIFRVDGTTAREPPDRVLATRNVDLLEVYLPPECAEHQRREIVPADARLRLELNAAGRVERARLAAASGNPCSDGMMIGIAELLWYRWLPNETYSAPVELIQPMRVVTAADG